MTGLHTIMGRMRFYESLGIGRRDVKNVVSVAIVVLMVAVTGIDFLSSSRLLPYVVVSDFSLARPWTFLTYEFLFPLMTSGFLGVIIFIVVVTWILWLGPAFERDLGSTKFAIFWLVASALPALFMYIGGRAINTPVLLVADPIAPLANMMVVWGQRNRTARVLLMGMLDISGQWMALIAVVFMLFEYGREGSPFIGAFGCLSLVIAYLFARDMIPGLPYAPFKQKPSKTQSRREQAFFDDVRKREQDRAERERLRKLFESNSEE